MKIIYVKDTNALEFDKANKEKMVFAKYFSPGCPACIAMESEWDNMCKDIDEKYDTDLILAQIDPTGMNKLEETPPATTNLILVSLTTISLNLLIANLVLSTRQSDIDF